MPSGSLESAPAQGHFLTQTDGNISSGAGGGWSVEDFLLLATNDKEEQENNKLVSLIEFTLLYYE